MAKIVLVNPQIVTSNWNVPLGTKNSVVIRHALSYLSAALKKENHEVILLDLRFLKGWEDYEERLRKYQPDFVGVTGHTCEWLLSLESCERAKKANPNTITILGGIQATMFPEEAIKHDYIDYVMKGEGEASFPKFVANPSSFPKVFWGEPPNLDEIPFEDRELWPDYAERIKYPILQFGAELPVVDMLTKRGCPWQCKFCCGPGEQHLYTREINGKRVPYVRARSVSNVMEEMNQLMDKYNFRSIVFHDNEFLLDHKWMTEFCQAMHRYGFVAKGVKWWAALRADMMCRYPKIIEQMKEAGLDMASIGFESFSDRILKWMNKGTTAEINFKAAKLCKDLDIKIFANTILGLPWSDGKWHKEDDVATLEAIKKIKPYSWAYSYYTPIPNSYFYKWFKENNLILDDSMEALGRRRPYDYKVKGVDYIELGKLLEHYLIYTNPVYKRIPKLALKKIGLFDFAKKQYGRYLKDAQ